MDVVTIIRDGLRATPLTILLFGPSLTGTPRDDHVRALQAKRRDVRDELTRLGHTVLLIEDLIDLSVPPPLNNAWLQELAILQRYDSFDLIVVLIQTPGTTVELGALSMKPELSRRSHFFLCNDYSAGAAWSACEAAAQVHGAAFTPYDYPKDLIDCHLLGWIVEKVRAVQAGKFLF